ncbi:unnamed protein product [Amoebophrya sp. A25]|nr:unnamed protein product [Amoebophrya sp. A25]|eukprot:GSA25T00026934001.1
MSSGKEYFQIIKKAGKKSASKCIALLDIEISRNDCEVFWTR